MTGRQQAYIRACQLPFLWKSAVAPERGVLLPACWRAAEHAGLLRSTDKDLQIPPSLCQLLADQQLCLIAGPNPTH
jgi:hypothetical protein